VVEEAEGVRLDVFPQFGCRDLRLRPHERTARDQTRARLTRGIVVAREVPRVLPSAWRAGAAPPSV
jgi:hypothetical protein